MLSEKRRVCYGGARGGGKSWVVRAKATMLAVNYSGIKILILRRTYADLWQNHVLELRKVLEPDIATYRDSEKAMIFPNGRPKIPEDARAMLKAATPAAVKLLVDTLNNPEEKTETRVKCAETVLDRVYGKANQPIDLGGEIPKIEIVLGNGKEYAK